MTVFSFDDARAIVRRALAELWTFDLGELYVAPYGYEDAESWHVIAGSRQAIVDRDRDYAIMDLPAFFVDKRTGKLDQLPVFETFDRIDAMTPVGDIPPD